MTNPPTQPCHTKLLPEQQQNAEYHKTKKRQSGCFFTTTACAAIAWRQAGHEPGRQEYYSVGNRRKRNLGLDLLDALARLARNHNLTVLVHLDLGNHNVRGMNRNLNSGTVRLLLLESLKVHNPLRTVNLDNAALRALRRATHNANLIVLADGNSANLDVLVLFYAWMPWKEVKVQQYP